MTQATKPQRQPDAAALARLQNSRTPRLWITDLDGQRLRDLRRQHGLSQGALAEQAGISLTTVARLERQLSSPCRTWTLAALAAALGEQTAGMKFAGTRAR
jgi:DNA-binding XRE family transcriptional regulator